MNIKNKIGLLTPFAKINKSGGLNKVRGGGKKSKGITVDSQYLKYFISNSQYLELFPQSPDSSRYRESTVILY